MSKSSGTGSDVLRALAPRDREGDVAGDADTIDDRDEDGYRLIRPLRVRAIPPDGEPTLVYEFDNGVAPSPASVSSAHRSRCHSDTHP